MIAKHHPSTVDFVVSTECVQAVVALLLSHKISFMLTPSNHLEINKIDKELRIKNFHSELEHENAEVTQESVEPLRMRNINTWDGIIKKIYRKYLVEGFEQVPPTEQQIAIEYNIPLNLFKNNFKAIYGKPFYQLYMDKRMEHAAKLLRNGYKAVEVSRCIGYSDSSCIKFNKMFQKHFGITPKKYQLLHIGRLDRRVV
ncbi:MAG TPA: hypothetical protein DCM71_12385 [Runella sp.]|nr:hypothetical protein [Runella sp.]